MKVIIINVLALTVPKIYKNLNLFLGKRIPYTAIIPIIAPDAPSEGIFPSPVTTAITPYNNEPTRPEMRYVMRK